MYDTGEINNKYIYIYNLLYILYIILYFINIIPI